MESNSVQFGLQTEEILIFFASSEKKPFKRARDGAYCPIKLPYIKAEIRAVDTQSDLRIFL